MFHWGWFPDPDPDFILSIMSCGQRPPAGIWSDSFYCNEEYDRMYQEQKTLLDLDERAEVIKEMQRMVYEDAPYIVLYYDKNLQAYSDDWEGFVQQPEGVGDLLAAYGPTSYISIRPASAESGSTDDSEGISPVVWIAIIGGIVLVAVVAMVVRRRVGDEDRA
jgi:peptide/nickel transport system substrate-binding protein